MYEAIIEQEESLDSILSLVDFSEIQDLLNKELPIAKTVDETNNIIFDSDRSYPDQTRIFKEYLEKK